MNHSHIDDESPGGRRDFNRVVFNVTFIGGSDVHSMLLPTDDLIIDDVINEANEEFLLLMEVVESGSDILEFDEERNGILIFNILDDDGTHI